MKKKMSPASLANLKLGKPIQPGEVRNPSGRPILERTIRALLEERDLDKLKAFVANLYNQAMPHKVEKVFVGEGGPTTVAYTADGDMTAAQILIERGYGKVPQNVDVDGDIALKVSLPDALDFLVAKAKARKKEDLGA